MERSDLSRPRRADLKICERRETVQENSGGCSVTLIKAEPLDGPFPVPLRNGVS